VSQRIGDLSQLTGVIGSLDVDAEPTVRDPDDHRKAVLLA
jgi:hypothetical protein